MEEKKVSSKLHMAYLLFALYFSILITERIYSILRSIFSFNIFSSIFSLYPYLICLLLLIATIILICLKSKYLFYAPFSFDQKIYSKINVNSLIIPFGLILFCSRIITENSIILVQILAYLILYVGLAIYIVEDQKKFYKAGLLLFSCCYLFFFFVLMYLACGAKFIDINLQLAVKNCISLFLSAIITFLIYKSLQQTKPDAFFVIPMALALVVYIVILEL